MPERTEQFGGMRQTMLPNGASDQINEHVLDFLGSARLVEEMTCDRARLYRRNMFVLCDRINLALIQAAKRGAVLEGDRVRDLSELC